MNRFGWCVAVGLVCTTVLRAGDGTWTGAGGWWNDDTRWKDYQIAGGGIDDIAYLHSTYVGAFTSSPGDLSVTNDVVLHGIEVTGVIMPTLRLTQSSNGALRMRRNAAGADPYIKISPAWMDNNAGGLHVLGDNLITGEGDSILTVQGGTVQFVDGSVSNYAMSGFARVDLKDFSRVAFGNTAGRGITDGDLRIVRTKFNFDNGKDTPVSIAKGRMFLGPGISHCRMGRNYPVRFPSEIVREPRGFLAFEFFSADQDPAYTLPNPEQYLNEEGRFHTWILSSSFELCGYTEDGKIGAFSNYQTSFDAVTEKTSFKSSSAITLAQDRSAAVVHMTGELTFPDGVTLTLGNDDEPGLLSLGNSLRGSGGNLTFKGAEGVLMTRNDGQRIEPKLVGANSISVIANSGSVGGRTKVYFDNPANTFSGGLDILFGTVVAGRDGVLGTGPVRVDGFPGSYAWGFDRVLGRGGSLSLTGVTLTNELSLAGTGPASSTGPLCALYLNERSRVEGPVTLANGAAIRTDGSISEISGSIDGHEDLYLWPAAAGTLRLSGAVNNPRKLAITSPTNTVKRVARMGTVSVAPTAALNVDVIRNDATLAFESARTYDGTLSGSGLFTVSETDATTVFGKSIEQGGLYVKGRGVVRLQAATNTVGTLVGEATIDLASADAQLTIGSTEVGYDGYFTGSIQTPAGGKLKLVKTGDNTQILGGALSFDGDIVVEEGTLKLGGFADRLPRTAAAPVICVDAADPTTLTTNAEGRVSAWTGKGGLGADLLQTDESRQPVYDPSAMGGRGGVVFKNTDIYVTPMVINRLATSAAVDVKKVFMAYAINRATCYGTLIGGLDQDSTGIRMGWTTEGSQTSYGLEESYLHSRMWGGENTLLNGTAGERWGKCSEIQLVESMTTNRPFSYRVAVGQCFSDEKKTRGIDGAIGEVLVYSALTPPEDYMVTLYMRNKWGFTNIVAASENVLPTGAALTVKEGAVLDLAGVNQTLGRLDNYGTITNSSARPVVITVDGGTLSGKIAGNITVVKTGDDELGVDIYSDLAGMDGKVVAESGKVQVRTWRNSRTLPVTEGLSFHLDAADLASMTINADREVTLWKDKSGNGVDFAEDRHAISETYPLPPPKYDASLNNGRGAIVCCGNASTANANRLSTGDRTCAIRTVILFTMTDTADGVDSAVYSTKYWFAGMFGRRNVDNGIRLNSYNSFNPYGFASDTSRWYVNGLNATGFAPGENYILEMGLKDRYAGGYVHGWSLGQYMGTRNAAGELDKDGKPQNHGGLRGYNGNFTEVIAYDRYLTREERARINAYLREKWIEGDMTDVSLAEQVKLELGADATLDLAGTAQTLNGLSGAGGTIVNGAVTIDGTLEVAFDEAGETVPHRFENATLADGLTIAFNGTPTGVHHLIATGVGSANVSTFVLPNTPWKVVLSKGNLSLTKSGMMITIR